MIPGKATQCLLRVHVLTVISGSPLLARQYASNFGVTRTPESLDEGGVLFGNGAWLREFGRGGMDVYLHLWRAPEVESRLLKRKRPKLVNLLRDVARWLYTSRSKLHKVFLYCFTACWPLPHVQCSPPSVPCAQVGASIADSLPNDLQRTCLCV